MSQCKSFGYSSNGRTFDTKYFYYFKVVYNIGILKYFAPWDLFWSGIIEKLYPLGHIWCGGIETFWDRKLCMNFLVWFFGQNFWKNLKQFSIKTMHIFQSTWKYILHMKAYESIYFKIFINFGFNTSMYTTDTHL